MRTMRTLGVVSAATVILLMSGASDAFAAKQVYRAHMSCEGSGSGLAQVKTLVLRGGGIAEPFFKLLVDLSNLPDLPVTSCQATLVCPDLIELPFDCAQSVEGRKMDFSSGPVFYGVLHAPCRWPSVRVDLQYPGESHSCYSGF